MVAMKDDTAKGKVIINKTEADNKEEQPEGNEAQPHDSGTTGRISPKTGDNTNLWFPIALMIGAAGLAGGILCGSKKKKKQNKQDNCKAVVSGSKFAE